MHLQFSSFVLLLVLAYAAALPWVNLELDNKETPHYPGPPILSRPRREAAEFFGSGGASRQRQSGSVGFNNPNGSGGSVGYGHANGQGHIVSVDGKVPVWSSRRGDSTLNLGGGVTQKFGGPGGSRPLDKRVGVYFNHRF